MPGGASESTTQAGWGQSAAPAAGSSDVGVPSVNLPSGGGAIRGLGEEFQTDLAGGSATLHIPVQVSPARGGFQPQLALNYDSSQGNGPFGLGWQISVPSIRRKESRGIPRYRDDGPDADTFCLGDGQDLVPALAQQSDGSWTPVVHSATYGGKTYTVQRFRPRIEGLNARIERWRSDDGDVLWRATSAENVTTLYGDSATTRISDPADPRRVAVWLMAASFDGRGNAVQYDYKAEDDTGIDVTAPAELHRTSAQRAAQRYLKRVRYGNATPRLAGDDLSLESGWLFETVLDYGEHYVEAAPVPPETEGTVTRASVADIAPWPVRADVQSSRRYGFELRSYRLCRRILQFHHFGERLPAADLLVRALHLDYRESPIASFVVGVVSSGYLWQGGGSYGRRSWPTLQMTYSEAVLDPSIHDVDPAVLGGLPIGAGPGYEFVDLDGDGVAGLLAEHQDSWVYHRNLSAAAQLAAPDGDPGVAFGPAQQVGSRPRHDDSDQRWHWVDLVGDGQLDLLGLGEPAVGVYERGADGGWSGFQPLTQAPQLDWADEQVQLVDLTGDGRMDVLRAGDDAHWWYPYLEEQGFAAGQAIPHSRDDDVSPRVLFSGGAEVVVLADMTGDGLSDIVRVRNGDVCYWPSLGYGTFGAKVTMGNSPWFGDEFSSSRLQVADIDGSGPADLLYLDGTGVSLFANQSGNAWGPRQLLADVPPITEGAVRTVDLFGNGTACLLWSSQLPADSGRQMRYLELMGRLKPHLLTSFANNLGRSTHVSYGSSAGFAVADAAAGRPWATRLPLAMQVVTSVRVEDAVDRTRFTSRYAYHHGYFDGREREFGGFGFVEQWDATELGALAASGDLGPVTNLDPATHVPPVLTRSWFHTGAELESDWLETAFAGDYYVEPGAADLPEQWLATTVLPEDTTADEVHDVVRALRGVLLRREVFSADGTAVQDQPYTVSEQSYAVVRVQPRAANRYPVFRTHARESLDLEYDRTTTVVAGKTVADPRAHHQLVLEADDFGNLLLSLDIVYGRRHPDPTLPPADQAVQQAPLAVLTRRGYTDPVDRPDGYRPPLLARSQVSQLYGFESQLPAPPRPLAWQQAVAIAADAAGHELPYPDVAGAGAVAPHVWQRLVEDMRTRYLRNDLAGALPDGQHDSLGLADQSYSLALTPEILEDSFAGKVSATMVSAAGYVALDGGTDWWVPTGRVRYSPTGQDSAAQELAWALAHFYLPHRFVDALGGVAEASYDAFDLYVVDSVDGVGNRTSAGERASDGTVTPSVDYRVLAPLVVTDINRNRNEVVYDTLGQLVLSAVTGKSGENVGDSIAGLSADLAPSDEAAFVLDPVAHAAVLLGGASHRTVYVPRRFELTGEPAIAVTISRLVHLHDSQLTAPDNPLISFAYSNGDGAISQSKDLAEPGPLTPGGPTFTQRWVCTGWTISDNKGNRVRGYEPFFSADHEFEFANLQGVSGIAFFDPIGRIVGGVSPDHSWSKTSLGPWQAMTWDASDVVLTADPSLDPDVAPWFARLPATDYLPTWYGARSGGALGPAQADAATKASAHDNTPGVSYYDAMGRLVRMDEDDGSGTLATTRTHLDVEGNRLAVTDALGRTAATSTFDLRGRPLHTFLVDAGDRWQLADVGGKAVYAWDARGNVLRTEYDVMARPTGIFTSNGGGPERLAERIVYGEAQGDAGNHRGKAYQSFDDSGLVENTGFDFEGNPVAQFRQLLRDPTVEVNWSTTPLLLPDRQQSSAVFDAQRRPVVTTDADGSVTTIVYNQRGFPSALSVVPGAGGPAVHVISSAVYTVLGEMTQVSYGNGVQAVQSFDPLTRRLSRAQTLRAGVALTDVSFAYDPSGNVTTKTDAAQQTVYFNNAVVEATGSYTYDARYRLISASGREHAGQAGPQQVQGPSDADRMRLPQPNDGQAMRRYTQTYSYDAVGNLMELAHAAGGSGWTRRYQYSAGSNRLDSTTLPGDPTTGPLPADRYPHDGNGNITAMPHLTGIGWDFKDRMRTLDLGGGGSVRFTYDANGQRVRKLSYRQNGTLQHEQLFLGPVQVERDFGADGTTVTLERQTLHVQPGQLVSVETRTAGADAGPAQLVRYRYNDLLGSSVLELDPAGAIITYEEYHPYGTTSYQSVRSQTETPKRYRFGGKGRDEESGFSNFSARMYAPWLGRFVSADPAGLVDGPNLYLFVRANPITTVDPTGRDSLGGLNSVEGKYEERVRFKNLDEYAASNASSYHTVNEDGTVDATVWRDRPLPTIAPSLPQPKPAPKKPKVVKAAKKEPPPVDVHTLFKIAEALQPHLVYPKIIRQIAGGVQAVGGGVEAVGGTVTAVVTAETVVGAVAGGAVALHGVDNATSGWTQMVTGEESKTWTFQAAAGYASMATDDVELQNAIGSSVDTAANVASAWHGISTIPSLPTAKLPGAAALLADADEVAAGARGYGARINTGTGTLPNGQLVAENNCPFTSTAGANAVPSTSTGTAAFAGLPEGPLSSLQDIGNLLAGVGLGDGVPALQQVPINQAMATMRAMPKTTKFVLALDWVNGGGHVINGRVGTFGLYFVDNQTKLALPFFTLPSQARAVTVFVVYTP